MAKVVRVSSYGRETVADILVKENLSNEDAQAVARMANKGNFNLDFWYAAKPDDYVLSGGMEDLV